MQNCVREADGWGVQACYSYSNDTLTPLSTKSPLYSRRERENRSSSLDRLPIIKSTLSMREN